ncbi:MAG: hypothetical protein HRT44_06010 [Bdellovibrionales bacterium]|nr:hypothetical protein [Bdellovibrionales bacterium]NQZ18797.1 hypothetical protein [Bdellovibrionales bacterium]
MEVVEDDREMLAVVVSVMEKSVITKALRGGRLDKESIIPMVVLAKMPSLSQVMMGWGFVAEDV